MSNPAPATIAPTPEEEMVALVAKATTLSRQALDFSAQCLDLSMDIPRVVAAQVAAAVAQFHSDVGFIEEAAPTPDEIDALFPPGTGDNQTWHVVCVGRHPGLYPSSTEADPELAGVPNQCRRKKTGRLEALAYYRRMYDAHLCRKMTQVGPGFDDFDSDSDSDSDAEDAAVVAPEASGSG
ncbi:hypothetical protein FB451DRAFT_1556370 [Mycena latifolia]|nr:hypothetical protein FB451DRAFT_1571934 [Mycena latifolia]KAJ7480907.1 hypothetical protein FB451DRAFT_1556370 [Mycena latifolia]